MTTWQVLTGDVRERLRELPAQSVQTCVTSPPYWGLRDYGHAGQTGLEASPDQYTEAMVSVFVEVWRVLRDDGTVWLNLGDSYAGGDGMKSQRPQRDNSGGLVNNRIDSRGQQSWTDGATVGAFRSFGCLKPKDLVGIPWRVAFALQAAGWYLRSDIIWHKPNPMPESVTDRPTKAHEYLFLLSKAERYYYDAEAISEAVLPSTLSHVEKYGGTLKLSKVDASRNDKDTIDYFGGGGMRNKRTVWTVTTQPYPEAHFATFPEALIEPCILAGSRIGDTVLDPFTGSGTTGAVSVRHQRCFVGVELNPAYVTLARQRIGAEAPLFAAEVAC